ncbi:MAG: hypothetical protein IT288_14870 [Bdellovibrionales bacterium]|nr:hypothetical protein [Bdellovibrionales bacterium]
MVEEGRGLSALAQPVVLAVLMAVLVLLSPAPTARALENKSKPSPSEANSQSRLRVEDETIEKRLSGEWAMGVGGESFSEAQDEGTMVGFTLRPRMTYKLTESFDIYADAKLQLITSQVQSRFNDSVQSGILPYEVAARFRPFSFLEIKGGALSQGYLNAPLLITDRAFPGVSETLRAGSKKTYLEFIASQTIPTSTSFETMRVEKEKTPTFVTETLRGGLQLKNAFELTGSATHWKYGDLPAVVAYESSRWGNSTSGELPGNSFFNYDFEGWLAGAEACLCVLDTFKIRGGGYWLENTKADPSFNRGQEMFLRADMGIMGAVVSPYYLQFFNESDTSPARYNSGARGHNNRQGDGFGIEILFRSYNFRVVAEYLGSEVINPNASQEKLDSVFFKVETLYVEF